MAAPDFPGRERLVHLIDQALGGARVDPAHLQRVLESLHREQHVILPAAVLEPHPERYLRRRIHASREHGYQIIAMTWGPRQGSPLHDHDGHWCVDCLWHGELDIVRYDVSDQRDNLLRFTPHPAQRAKAGSGDWLTAPAEHHTMTNPHPSSSAVSLHVYPYSFSRCGWFEATGDDGWHRRHLGELVLDPWQ